MGLVSNSRLILGKLVSIMTNKNHPMSVGIRLIERLENQSMQVYGERNTPLPPKLRKMLLNDI